MPGSISDDYDPEWGTATNRGEIEDCLREVYKKVSSILDEKPPIYIMDLVHKSLPHKTSAVLTEKQWRLLRFALERAMESL